MKHDNKIIDLSKRDNLLKERPKTHIRRIFFSLTITLFILIVIYFASSLSRLGFINFEGLDSLSRSEMISLIDLNGDELFISINLSEVRNNIETHPLIEDAFVSRTGINHLRIEIVEHIVAVCALIEEELFYVLSDGVLIREDDFLRGGCDEVIVYDLDAEVIDNGVLSLFAGQLMNVDEEVRSLIQSIEYAPAYGDIHRFSLLMSDGNTAIVSSHTMPERLNLYHQFLSYIGEGQTGTFRMDVGVNSTFIPYEN